MKTVKIMLTTKENSDSEIVSYIPLTVTLMAPLISESTWFTSQSNLERRRSGCGTQPTFDLFIFKMRQN